MNGWTWLAIFAATLAGWLAYRRTREVACTIDLASTPLDFHAHVVLDGVEVNEGDAVLVHGAPDRIGIGEVRRCGRPRRCSRRAGPVGCSYASSGRAGSQSSTKSDSRAER